VTRSSRSTRPPSVDGTQAELARIPFADNSLYKVPEGLGDEQVFLSDILPTGFEVGVLNGNVRPGEEDPAEVPWPLTRAEVESFAADGLDRRSSAGCVRGRVDDSGRAAVDTAVMERSARLPIWAGRPVWADDAVLAAGLAAFGVVGTLGAVDNQPTSRPPGTVGWMLLAVASGAVAFRRRHPVAVLAVTAAATAGWLVARHPYGPVFLPLCVAVYTAASSTPRRRFPRLAAGVGGLLVVLVAVGVSDGRGRLWDEVPNQLPRVLLAWATLLGIPLWVGWAARVRRRRATEESRRRADEERLRVARELHDVVSHSIAMINFRAGVALHVIDRRPGEARSALEAIRQGSAGAMQELRAALGVLRDPEGGSPRAAVPGLAQLEELVAGVAGAGRVVELVVEGDPGELPPAVDLTAYRVVQESLTNVVRHAGPAAATVRVAYRPDQVVVEVTDDGNGLESASGRRSTDSDPQIRGSGIAGMRERVAAAGGELDAGPRPGGGFQVTARLPR
jgi:signal transduction histidine kinase